MKTIFDKNIKAKLIERIGQINQNNKAEWGEMSVFQMLKHNTYWNGWIIGKDDHKYKQAFMGKIFGKIALKMMIKDEKPFDKNIPTSTQFKVKELNGELEPEKYKWISLINEYENYNNPKFIHDFFGKMTKEQIGILVYKHTDHHLRQFGGSVNLTLSKLIKPYNDNLDDYDTTRNRRITEKNLRAAKVGAIPVWQRWRFCSHAQGIHRSGTGSRDGHPFGP